MVTDSDKIIETIDIAQEIGEYVKLSRTGQNYKGLCPFHQENSPSFVVSPHKKIFKCFGCGKSGTVIQFTMYRESLNFIESLEWLGQKYGLELSVQSHAFRERSEKERRASLILNYATEFFQRALQLDDEQEAMHYLTKRGVSQESISRFRLGYAPSGWETLFQELTEAGFHQEELAELGLISQSKEGKYFDFFRRRVIFPICNDRDEVVGFGGRTLEADGIKYLNSIESSFFKKNRLLYGWTQRGQDIKKRDFSIITEGYLDTIALHQASLTNSVAALGTTISDEHIKKLAECSKNVVLALDMDEAGEQACEVLSLKLKEAGFNIKRLQLVGAKDPDEYIQKYGTTSLIERLRDSIEVFDFLFMRYSRPYDLTQLEGQKSVLELFKPFFKKVKHALEYDNYTRKLSDYLKVSHEVICAEFPLASEFVKAPKYSKKLKERIRPIERLQIDKQESLEYETICLLLNIPTLKEHLERLGVRFSNVLYQSIYDHIEAMAGESFEHVSKQFSQEVVKFIVEHQGSIEALHHHELKEDILREWHNIILKEELTQLKNNFSKQEIAIKDRQTIFNRIREIQMLLKNDGGLGHE